MLSPGAQYVNPFSRDLFRQRDIMDEIGRLEEQTDSIEFD